MTEAPRPPSEQLEQHEPPVRSGEGAAPVPGALLPPLGWAVVLLLIVCFASYLQWMWQIWMRSEYYGHGFVIPVISGYLVYRRRAELLEAAGATDLRGLALLLPGLALFLVAVNRDVNFVQGFAMVMVIGGLILLLWGPGRTRLLLFPIAFLAFMVPVDRLLVQQFSNPLQIYGAAVAAHTVSFIGVAAELRGTTIAIPDYTFEVAQACSGLKSIIAMSALAALFAFLVEGPWWKRLLLFVAGAPIAMAANSLRITFTLILGRAFGPEAAEGFFHTLSGLMVFILALIGLFLMARLLRCDTMRQDI